MHGSRLHRADRRTGPGQGGDRLGWGLRPRADARRVRRHGHARRRLSGPGVHLAHARPGAGGHQGRRRRRRGAAHRQELHGRRHELRDGGRPGPRRGHHGRVGRDRRRRRGARQPVHRRSPWRGRDGAGREDLRGGGRAAPAAGRRRRALPQGKRERTQHGHGPHVVHRADGRQAHLRARSRRDGGRRGDPRRAGPRAPQGGLGARCRGDSGDGDRGRSALQPGRPCSCLRERPGGHAAHGALRRVQGAPRVAGGPGHHHRPQPDRLLHHLARHGRLLDHAAAPRRRARGAVGRRRS